MITCHNMSMLPDAHHILYSTHNPSEFIQYRDKHMITQARAKFPIISYRMKPQYCLFRMDPSLYIHLKTRYEPNRSVKNIHSGMKQCIYASKRSLKSCVQLGQIGIIKGEEALWSFINRPPSVGERWPIVMWRHRCGESFHLYSILHDRILAFPTHGWNFKFAMHITTLPPRVRIILIIMAILWSSEPAPVHEDVAVGMD
jgi:hypothetical protein